jgi:putative addiction module killer protein
MNKDCSYCILQTPEYREWINNEPPRSQVQINKRLSMIKFDGHFGDHKSVSFCEKGELKDKVWELRWMDGRRIYYAYIPEKKILLLLGGNKNGQNKDVSKAKAIYLKTTTNCST